jgi:hypothetical protein
VRLARDGTALIPEFAAALRAVSAAGAVPVVEGGVAWDGMERALGGKIADVAVLGGTEINNRYVGSLTFFFCCCCVVYCFISFVICGGGW